MRHAATLEIEHKFVAAPTNPQNIERNFQAHLPVSTSGTYKDHFAETHRVSVVIPCYNQGHFLGAAITSALGQTYRRVEVIVVDDGSSDNTSEVARSYPSIRYIRQNNMGLAGARNTGCSASRGSYLVFLDADDLLLRGALQAGATCLQANPDCAFASGDYYYMNTDGSVRNKFKQRFIEREHYEALLQGNYIGMHATVMYRRQAIELAGGFDTTLPVCEDYDLYLRIAREHPVCCHGKLVAAYRQHSSNISGDPDLMLTTALHVLRRQAPYIRSSVSRKHAYGRGLAFWKAFYGEKMVKRIKQMKLRGERRAALLLTTRLAELAPGYAIRCVIGRALRALRSLLRRDYNRRGLREPQPTSTR